MFICFRAALKLSEGIAIERESLVKQLDLLRYAINASPVKQIRPEVINLFSQLS